MKNLLVTNKQMLIFLQYFHQSSGIEAIRGASVLERNKNGVKCVNSLQAGDVSVMLSNSLQLDMTSNNSASHQDPSCISVKYEYEADKVLCMYSSASGSEEVNVPQLLQIIRVSVLEPQYLGLWIQLVCRCANLYHNLDETPLTSKWSHFTPPGTKI